VTGNYNIVDIQEKEHRVQNGVKRHNDNFKFVSCHSLRRSFSLT